MVLPGVRRCARAPRQGARLAARTERRGRFRRRGCGDRRRPHGALERRRRAAADGVRTRDGLRARRRSDPHAPRFAGPQAPITWPVFEQLRAEWRGRIELQGVSNIPIDVYLSDEGAKLADRVAAAGGVLGCITRFRSLENTPLPPEFDVAMTRLVCAGARTRPRRRPARR